MAQEFATAGDHLRSAVDQYVRVCSFAQDAGRSGGRLNSNPDLMKNLEKESAYILSQIQKLEGARAAILAARSSIPKATHNTTLPAEILARIFSLILPGQTCIVQRGYSGSISGIKYPLYPDALAHVCSFWRRVAFTVPALWTHIDIALDHTLNPGLAARAKVYAARAGRSPLEIHISDPGSEREKTRPRDARVAPGVVHKPSHEWDDLHDFKILPSDSVPIKALEMDLHVDDRFRESYYSMLEYFFARCKPGVLIQYAARVLAGSWVSSRPFVEPAETPYSQNGALLAMPSTHLEELWLRIPIIRINGLCPHWKSKAYYGLVELYIGEGIPEISESQLVHILKSSPKLRVFHFKTLLDEFSEDEIDPVYLEDLQELSLMVRGDDQLSISTLIQLITPGPEPLQLSIASAPMGIVEFFSRANVTRCYVWCPAGDLISALGQCRGLEVLVINECDSGAVNLSSLVELSDESSDFDESDDYPPLPVSPSACRIHTLYLLWHVKLVFEQILAVIEKYSVQRLLIYHGTLSYQTGEGRIQSQNLRNIKAKLSAITTCPTIEYYPDGYPDAYSEGEASDPDGWIRDAARS